MSDTDIEIDNAIDTTDTHDVDKNYELAQGIVSDVLGDKPADAMDKMNDIMLDKVRDAIAGKRVEVAQHLMNPEPQQELESEIEEDETEDEVVVDDLETEQETEEEDEDIQGDQ